jgi:hypothetical protein
MRVVAATIVAALLVAGCGSTQGNETGPVSAETVKQLEDLLHARASAMAKGDRNAFLATIDTTRLAFRRIQLREFEFPTVRGTLASTFKISNVERYRGYMRGFVEETLEGNFFAGSFNGGRAYYRHYFRNDGGKWILTEPTGDETGPEKKKVSGDVEIGYWALDEDVSEVLLRSVQAAQTYAQAQATKPVGKALVMTFVPTAELAGPGWEGFSAGNQSVPGRESLYPWWWAFDESRTHVSAYTEFTLRRSALGVLRESVAPGVGARLVSDQWLEEGWYDFAAGLDVTVTVRQGCTGLTIPTFAELRAGLPFAQPGVAPDAYGRFTGYATSMVAFLYERYGADAYWKLMMAYLQSASAAVNFPKVLQVTPEEFYAAWLVWLKKKYC